MVTTFKFVCLIMIIIYGSVDILYDAENVHFRAASSPALSCSTAVRARDVAWGNLICVSSPP